MQNQCKTKNMLLKANCMFQLKYLSKSYILPQYSNLKEGKIGPTLYGTGVTELI